MQVGDLVQHIRRQGYYGIITKILPLGGFVVWFSEGEYRVDGDALDLIK